jgi:MscS family membrane protein
MEIDVSILNSMIANKWLQVLVVLVGTFVVRRTANFFIKQILLKITRKTSSDLDDSVIEIVEYPIAVTIILIGLGWIVQLIGFKAPFLFVLNGIIKSIGIVIWARACNQLLQLIFTQMENLSRFKIVQPRTVPIFNMCSLILIWGGAIYMVLLTWHLDVTGWMASAGVVGIAFGFAAKDTLANLFAGFFIIADAPYQLGDYIILGSGERGVVTDIGIRSTRLLTRDDIEVIVPNAIIANTKIVNEDGGPHKKERVRCTVAVAYGSDIAMVRQNLMAALEATELLCRNPEPRVRFRSLGDSGLVFQVLGWIDEPVLRGRALDALNTNVYNKLNAAGIEIPYMKQDIYIKEMPGKKDQG